VAFTRKQKEQMESLFQVADNKDLGDISELYQLRRTWLNNKARRSFIKGENVTFNHNGNTIRATIRKINPKTIEVGVTTGGQTTVWKVAPTYLNKVA